MDRIAIYRSKNGSPTGLPLRFMAFFLVAIVLVASVGCKKTSPARFGGSIPKTSNRGN